MRRLLPIVAVHLLAGIFLLRQNVDAAPIGSLDIYEGSAEIISREGEPSEQIEEGHTGSPVHPSDTIRVAPGGRVAVVLRDGSVFRLDVGTNVQISELTYNGTRLNDAGVEIGNGKIWWNTQPLAPGGSVEVETPTIVAAVRGTAFHTSYVRSVSEVYVSTHTVDVFLKSDPSLSRTLTNGMVLRVGDATAEEDVRRGASVLPQKEKSEWILFNEREDAKLAAKRGTATSSTASSNISSSRPAPAPASSTRSKADTPVPASSSFGRSSIRSSIARSSLVSNVRSSSVPSVSAHTLTRLVLTAERTELPVGERTPLYVTAFYSDGSRSGTHDVTWDIQPASIGTIDATGTFLAKAAGNATIVAHHLGQTSNELSLTVGSAAQAPAPERMTINYIKHPPPDTGTAKPLPTATFSAFVTYTDGKTVDVTQQVQWSVTGTAKGTITQDGAYRPSSQGTDTVTAVFQNISGSATITIP